MTQSTQATKPWKFSFAVSVSQTDFEAVGKGDWIQAAEFMSSLGCKGVELAIRNPCVVDVKVLQGVFEKYALKLSAIGTGQAFVDEHLSLTDDNEKQRLKTIARLKEHINLAVDFKALVIIGLIRGNVGTKLGERKKRFSYFKESLIEVLDYASKRNVTVAIEPLNRYECDFFNRADEVGDFISEIGYTNVGILLDTFHMNIEEKSIHDTIIQSQPFLKHIHIADSNRWYPGAGHIDFLEIINALKKIDYTGFLSGEMLPLPDLKTAIKKYIEEMKEVLNG